MEEFLSRFLIQVESAESTASLDHMRDQMEELRSAINARKQTFSRPEN